MKYDIKYCYFKNREHVMFVSNPSDIFRIKRKLRNSDGYYWHVRFIIGIV